MYENLRLSIPCHIDVPRSSRNIQTVQFDAGFMQGDNSGFFSLMDNIKIDQKLVLIEPRFTVFTFVPTQIHVDSIKAQDRHEKSRLKMLELLKLHCCMH